MKKIISTGIFVFLVTFLMAQQSPEGLFPGAKAPDFTGFDQNGNEIKLKDLVKKGPVVLVFYRGYWCPYCNKALKRLEEWRKRGSLRPVAPMAAYIDVASQLGLGNSATNRIEVKNIGR